MGLSRITVWAQVEMVCLWEGSVFTFMTAAGPGETGWLRFINRIQMFTRGFLRKEEDYRMILGYFPWIHYVYF